MMINENIPHPLSRTAVEQVENNERLAHEEYHRVAKEGDHRIAELARMKQHFQKQQRDVNQVDANEISDWLLNSRSEFPYFHEKKYAKVLLKCKTL